MNFKDAFSHPAVIDHEMGAIRIPSLSVFIPNWGVRVWSNPEAAKDELLGLVTIAIRCRLLAKNYTEPQELKKYDFLVTPRLVDRVKFNILREMNARGVGFDYLAKEWEKRYKIFNPKPCVRMDAWYFQYMLTDPKPRLDPVIDDVADFLGVKLEFSIASTIQETPT